MRDYVQMDNSTRELAEIAAERALVIAALDDKRDQAVLRAYNAGLTLREIARFLRVSIPTVQRALSRKRT